MLRSVHEHAFWVLRSALFLIAFSPVAQAQFAIPDFSSLASPEGTGLEFVEIGTMKTRIDGQETAWASYRIEFDTNPDVSFATFSEDIDGVLVMMTAFDGSMDVATRAISVYILSPTFPGNCPCSYLADELSIAMLALPTADADASQSMMTDILVNKNPYIGGGTAEDAMLTLETFERIDDATYRLTGTLRANLISMQDAFIPGAGAEPIVLEASFSMQIVEQNLE